jgi:Trk K+ transport system NAD-binding subunit
VRPRSGACRGWVSRHESLEIVVQPDYVFHEGDVLLLIGADAKLAEFTR